MEGRTGLLRGCACNGTPITILAASPSNGAPFSSACVARSWDLGKRQLLEVVDMSAFVAEQRAALASGDLNALMLPSEDVYRPENPDLAQRLMLDTPG